MPVQLKLQISSYQRLRKEAIEGLHQSVGGLINDQGERPGTPAQRESKASNQSPQTGHIDQDLDTMPAGSGKAGKQSEAVITETHRHRAEAQVDPDTAHDSAEVETFSERDHSADRRIEHNIERFNMGIRDAIEHSRVRQRKRIGCQFRRREFLGCPHCCISWRIAAWTLKWNRPGEQCFRLCCQEGHLEP